MKDKQISIKLEGEKKRDFLKALKTLETNPSIYLTARIDEAIELEKNRVQQTLAIKESPQVKVFADKYFNK